MYERTNCKVSNVSILDWKLGSLSEARGSQLGRSKDGHALANVSRVSASQSAT